MPQYIAGPPDLKIARRQPVARPELGEFTERFKALGSLLADNACARNQHAGIGTNCRGQRAAQLIHLRQAQALRIVDDDRIGWGNQALIR